MVSKTKLKTTSGFVTNCVTSEYPNALEISVDGKHIVLQSPADFNKVASSCLNALDAWGYKFERIIDTNDVDY